MNVHEPTIEVLTMPQGGDAWHEARAGVITASMFDVARSRVNELDERQLRYVELVRERGLEPKEAAKEAGYKAAPKSDRIERALAGEVVGESSDAARRYAFRLACERIGGVPYDQRFETWQMRRGRELEPIARELHAFKYGIEVEPAGFVRTTDGKFGASADGFIGPDGGAEYKAFLDPDRLEPILFTDSTEDVRGQMQGGLWLTGRRWWHLGLYAPQLEPIELDLYVLTENRDDEFIDAMVADLLRFDEMVEDYVDRLRDKARRVRAGE
jgi:hypothetical protein